MCQDDLWPEEDLATEIYQGDKIALYMAVLPGKDHLLERNNSTKPVAKGLANTS